MTTIHQQRYAEVSLADELAELRSQRRDELVAEAMEASGNYWNNDPRSPDCYDNEQEFEVFALVRRVMAMPTINPATRWELLMQLMREGSVAHYAEVRTHE